MKELLGLSGMALVFVLLLIPNLGQAQDVIEKRQKLMESNIDALKAIRAAEKEKDYNTIQAKAKEISGNMSRVADLFPKGSISEKSDAHPAIWERWDDFSKSAVKTKAAAEALQKAAAAKDEAQVNTQVKALGGMTSGACGECHLSFNKKRMKKDS
jgi:cytochrome c556